MNSAFYLEENDLPPPPSIWHRLNRVLWVMLILTVVATIIGAFLPQLQKQRVERDERARLQRLIEEQRTLHTHYTNEIGWIQNDPNYLADKYARDTLELMKPGEAVMRVEPAKPPALTPEVPTLAPELRARRN